MNTLHEVVSQYIDSPNLRAYIKTFTDEVITAGATIEDISRALDIDSVKGSALDIIGEIVGQKREWIDLSPIAWFGFEDGGLSGNKGFGVGILWNGIVPIAGEWSRANDDLYRSLIKSKIIKNNGGGTIEDVIKAIEILTGRKDILVEGGQGTTRTWFGFDDDVTSAGFDLGEFWNGSAPDTTSMEYHLIAPAGDPLSDFDKSLLANYGLLPTPAGVMMTGITP